MSRMPLIHMNGKAAGSLVGMPKPVEAPMGLRMKFMPMRIIARGIMAVNQKSGELLFKV